MEQMSLKFGRMRLKKLANLSLKARIVQNPALSKSKQKMLHQTKMEQMSLEMRRARLKKLPKLSLNLKKIVRSQKDRAMTIVQESLKRFPPTLRGKNPYLKVMRVLSKKRPTKVVVGYCRQVLSKTKQKIS